MFPPIYQYHYVILDLMIDNGFYLAVLGQVGPPTALYAHGRFLKLLLELIKGFIVFFNET